MLKCWNTCPSQRPSFTDLRKFFEDLVEEISDYLSLDFKQEYTENRVVNKDV